MANFQLTAQHLERCRHALGAMLMNEGAPLSPAELRAAQQVVRLSAQLICTLTPAIQAVDPNITAPDLADGSLDDELAALNSMLQIAVDDATA